MEDTPIISLKEAREIMGQDSLGMNDKELQYVIDQLNSLARAFVQMVQEEAGYAVVMAYNRENDE